MQASMSKETETANMKKCKTLGITQGSKALEKEKEDISNEEQTRFRSVAARINFWQRTERTSSLHPRTYAEEWPVLTRVTGKKHGELRDI